MNRYLQFVTATICILALGACAKNDSATNNNPGNPTPTNPSPTDPIPSPTEKLTLLSGFLVKENEAHLKDTQSRLETALAKAKVDKLNPLQIEELKNAIKINLNLILSSRFIEHSKKDKFITKTKINDRENLKFAVQGDRIITSISVWYVDSYMAGGGGVSANQEWLELNIMNRILKIRFLNPKRSDDHYFPILPLKYGGQFSESNISENPPSAEVKGLSILAPVEGYLAQSYGINIVNVTTYLQIDYLIPDAQTFTQIKLYEIHKEKVLSELNLLSEEKTDQVVLERALRWLSKAREDLRF